MRVSSEQRAHVEKQRTVLRQAAEVETLIEKARVDSEVFFRIVPRQERTNRLLAPLPHQRIHLAFMRAHARSVCFLPVNHGKTIAQIYDLLFDLGQNPELRCAVVSATQNQAKKLIRVVRDMIDHNKTLRLVFPDLTRGKIWTDENFVVNRTSPSKDFTCIAFGIDGGIAGTRLDRVLCDDILNRENTATKVQREKTIEFIDSSVYNRLEADGRISLNNTAWHPEDALHEFSKRGWATIRASIDGNIYIKDDAMNRGKPTFDHELLRSTGYVDPVYGEKLRIDAKGHTDKSMLWVDHPQIPSIAWIHDRFPIAIERNRAYYSMPDDATSAHCKKEWIDACKKHARLMGYHSLIKEWKQGLTFTGVDLAFSERAKSDDCAIFTFGLLPSKHRLILDIDVGKWDGPTIIDKLIDQQKRYDSIIRVEDNAAQKFILEFARERDVSLQLRPQTTGKNKNKLETGVQSLFVELYNGAWLIPNDINGRVHPNVARFIAGCTGYRPSKHVDDTVMAAWFSREQAREWGVLTSGGREVRGNGGISLQAR